MRTEYGEMVITNSEGKLVPWEPGDPGKPIGRVIRIVSSSKEGTRIEWMPDCLLPCGAVSVPGKE